MSMLRAALARRCRALAPALASPFASSARATVAEVAVPFTVVGLDGARHRCVGREGHSLVKGMQQAKLPLALMGINGYDAALRLPREWHDKVPEMDLAQVRHQRPVHFPQWRECAASACAPPPERAPQRPYLKAQQRESAPRSATQARRAHSRSGFSMQPMKGAVWTSRAPSGVRGARGTLVVILPRKTNHVGSTEGVRWKGYPSRQLHAAAFRVAWIP